MEEVGSGRKPQSRRRTHGLRVPPGGYFCLGQAASACLSASLGVTVPVAHRLSPTHRALLPTATGIESEASISTVVWRDWSSLEH